CARATSTATRASNVQTSLDVLLRLIRDLPGSLDYLRDHAARGQRSPSRITSRPHTRTSRSSARVTVRIMR
ncbi:MAG TPA: hypothetical protein VML75_26820, partial [Kofleriaceae bacterium]|nr:hypothetical protein [Kofleriaceae bacterium]